MRRITNTLLLTALALIAGCATPYNPNPRRDTPQTLASLDLPRYMGHWYNIAHIPYFAERGVVASYSEWTLRPDGLIDDVYGGRKHSFDAPETRDNFVDTVEPGTGNARWSVRIWGPITVTQMTLYVDPEYQYTILGWGDKSLAWIFSRTPDVDAKTYAELLGRLDQMGYDTSRVLRVPQKPADLGQPGYLKDDS
jgi:apolipoprotein D and lipocalin family protein